MANDENILKVIKGILNYCASNSSFIKLILEPNETPEIRRNYFTEFTDEDGLLKVVNEYNPLFWSLSDTDKANKYLHTQYISKSYLKKAHYNRYVCDAMQEISNRICRCVYHCKPLKIVFTSNSDALDEDCSYNYDMTESTLYITNDAETLEKLPFGALASYLFIGTARHALIEKAKAVYNGTIENIRPMDAYAIGSFFTSQFNLHSDKLTKYYEDDNAGKEVPVLPEEIDGLSMQIEDSIYKSDHLTVLSSLYGINDMLEFAGMCGNYKSNKEGYDNFSNIFYKSLSEYLATDCIVYNDYNNRLFEIMCKYCNGSKKNAKVYSADLPVVFNSWLEKTCAIPFYLPIGVPMGEEGVAGFYEILNDKFLADYPEFQENFFAIEKDDEGFPVTDDDGNIVRKGFDGFDGGLFDLRINELCKYFYGQNCDINAIMTPENKKGNETVSFPPMLNMKQYYDKLIRERVSGATFNEKNVDEK